MTRTGFCVFLLVLTFLLVPPVLGAGITFTAGQHEYAFLTGQPVVIPLATTNSFLRDINGTLQFSTDDQLQKAGTVMVRTENRVSAQVIPAGSGFLNLSMAGSALPRAYKVHISYNYADPAMIQVSLPEIIVRIVALPSQIQNSASPVTSTSGPAPSAVPGTSSVSISEQSVSVRQQTGSDSGGGSAPPGSQGGMNATAHQEQQNLDLEAFTTLLNHDPLFMQVNGSLTSQGFAIRSLDPRPSGNDTGTFSVVYGKGADSQVVLAGSMDGGIIPGLNGQSNMAIDTTPAIDTNTSLASYGRELATEGFRPVGMAFSRTPDTTSVNLSYTSAEGRNAFVNATETFGNVTGVTLTREAGPAPVLLIVTVVAAIVVVSVFLFLRSRRRKAGPAATRELQPPELRDSSAAALRLLESAHAAFAGGRFPEAYGGAGQALRLTLSARYGSGEEMTNGEVTAMMESRPEERRQAEEILSRCSEVEFARGEPDREEFSRFVRLIRLRIAE